MKRFLGWAAASALAACGDGGGGDSAPIVLPAPTPTSGPSASWNYPSYNDLTRSYTAFSDVGFDVRRGLITQDVAGQSSATIVVSNLYLDAQLFPADLRAAWNHSGDADTVRFDYGRVGSPLFTAADRKDVDGYRVYGKSDPTADRILVGLPPSMQQKYVTRVAWERMVGHSSVDGRPTRVMQYSSAFFGATSNSEDLLDRKARAMRAATFVLNPSYEGVGTIWYPSAPNPGFTPEGGSVISQTSNFGIFQVIEADDTVQATVNFNGFRGGSTPRTLKMVGKLDRTTGIFTADVTDQTDYKGRMRGRLYGPEGREAAFVFQATSVTDNATVTGDYVGHWTY